ncbi:MAG TPA: cupin domain-containing protein [Saprospiraceae bacterium]|nr:cupin domain-containing protein [Saprospiraceae bacterium]MCB9270519.1 cupin domain-containing protein [Lewinellaceae bacterium]HPG08747.1 cupin domain-containing protein [Saprospiraceae bacterium]HPQ99388.1 cupin domain-containing protein [Saprospiraceae bacterium]HQU52942.1 cupin domain-containing protein [Saprospiraceae bacterium]
MNGYWFLETLVKVRVSGNDSADHISLLEHRAYPGDSPPMHIHHNEDEIFVVLEGEFRFMIGTSEHRLKEKETILVPKGTPHSYRVESSQGGRWLTITTGHDFENFVKAISRPAGADALPERLGPPSEAFKAELASKAAEYQIELVGPPLH